ncbi:MAG: hypothetical protein LBK77_08005 [Spirochaetaceae bacterium]|jgi:uncharacterized protein YxjI|nr:hypothetical protein [Spirochaetaceae bacterium]
METHVQEFFKHDDYFIDEKVAFLKFTNAYKVYNNAGDLIGAIKETMPAGLKILSIFLNKSLFPFKLDILNSEEKVLATIKRGWTFFMSKISVTDSGGNTIAIIRQQFKFFKPTFHIVQHDETPIASITGDWKAWNFSIVDHGSNQIGTITKKWNGILKEAFTTADKYIVSINPGVVEDVKKIAVVATAITIDMVLKESK